MGIILDDTKTWNPASLEQSWIQAPFGLYINSNPDDCFKSIAEIQAGILAPDIEQLPKDDPDRIGVSAYLKELVSQRIEADSNNNNPGLNIIQQYYTRPIYSDTRVGGNDAVNPYWQFNKDDDITPPIMGGNYHTSDKDNKTGLRGMGRVYAETYDAQQQIVWLQAGVADYTGIMSFIRKAGNATANNVHNSGTWRGVVGSLIDLAKLTIGFIIKAFMFPVTKTLWAVRWLLSKKEEDWQVSTYIKFKPAMPLYLSVVNTLLTYLAYNMGMLPSLLAVNRRDSSKYLTEVKSNSPVIFKLLGLSPDEMEAVKSEIARKGITDKLIAEYPQLEKVRVGGVGDKLIFSDDTNGAYEDKQVVDVDLSDSRNQFDSLSGYKDDANLLALYRSNKTKYTDATGIPTMFKYEGLDIWQILGRRGRQYLKMMNDANTNWPNVQDMIREQRVLNQSGESKYFIKPGQKFQMDDNGDMHIVSDSNAKANDPNTWGAERNTIKLYAHGALDWVGFRVEKGVSNSETITSTSGPPSIAQKLNSYASQQRDLAQNAQQNWFAKFALKTMEAGIQGAIQGAFAEMGAKIASMVGAGDIGSILQSGNGFVFIPEIWTGSTFTKSFSLNIPLRARYGDPVSIMQSIYIPLMLLFGFGLPRGVGNAMYTSPFYIRAFSRGMLSIPFGLVQSINIRRGGNQFGWNANTLPLSVDVDLQIHDLAPTMFLGIMDNGLLDTFTDNTVFQDYLLSLCGTDLNELTNYYQRMSRMANLKLHLLKNKFNAAGLWAHHIGSYNLVRAITGAAFKPYQLTGGQRNEEATVLGVPE